MFAGQERGDNGQSATKEVARRGRHSLLQSPEPRPLSAQSRAQRATGARYGSAEPGGEAEGPLGGVVEIRQSGQRQRLLQRERRSALRRGRRSGRRALPSLRQRGDTSLIARSLCTLCLRVVSLLTLCSRQESFAENGVSPFARTCSCTGRSNANPILRHLDASNYISLNQYEFNDAAEKWFRSLIRGERLGGERKEF